MMMMMMLMVRGRELDVSQLAFQLLRRFRDSFIVILESSLIEVHEIEHIWNAKSSIELSNPS